MIILFMYICLCIYIYGRVSNRFVQIMACSGSKPRFGPVCRSGSVLGHPRSGSTLSDLPVLARPALDPALGQSDFKKKKFALFASGDGGRVARLSIQLDSYSAILLLLSFAHAKPWAISRHIGFQWDRSKAL